MKRKIVSLLGLLCVFALPCTARADVGTPLMWAGFLHLFFGNAVIGLAEGLAISWVFSVRKRRALPTMILANYFSAWVGAFFLGGMGAVLPMNLNTAWRWFWTMVFATYVLTVILEWPFVAWCFRGAERWFRQSVRASFLVQTASYLVLFGWYWLASDARIYTKMQIVPPSQLSMPEQVSIYFIAAQDGNVYRRSLKGGGEEKLQDLHSTDLKDRLVVRPAFDKTNSWELAVGSRVWDYRDPGVRTLAITLKAQAVPVTPPLREQEAPFISAEDQAPQLGTATNSDWVVYAERWNDYVTCYDRRSHAREHLAFETPLCVWSARNPFLLPSDLVLFQFGDDQICLFAPKERKLALLCRGRGAVPIIDQRLVEPSFVPTAGLRRR